MYLDSHLTWKPHVSFLTPKLARANGILSKLRHYVPQKVVVGIYHSLFDSHLNYEVVRIKCQLWGLSDNTTTHPVFILQKRAMHLITFSEFQSPLSPLFLNLKVESISTFLF